MKFIKILTKHINSELAEIINGCSEFEIDQIERVYFDLDYIEFVDKDGFIGMFLSTSDLNLRKLIDFYVSKSIKFSFEDCTKDVLLDRGIDVDGYKLLLSLDKDAKSEIDSLVSRFYQDNIDVDSILDKINEKGITSLTEFDKKVLK